MKDLFFVASMELAQNVLKRWQSLGATFIDPTPDADGRLALSKTAHLSGCHDRVYVTDADTAEVELITDHVQTGDGNLKFFIQERYGTPYIDFSFVGPRAEGDSVVAGHGQISVYSFHYNIETNDEVLPPSKLLTMYADAVRYLREETHTSRYHTEPKRFLVEKKIHHGDAGAWNDYRIPSETAAIIESNS